MIDLSALGLPPVQTSHHGGKHDKTGASHEHGKDAKSFGDLVKEAGKKGGGKHAAGDDIVADIDALAIDDLTVDDNEASDAAATLKVRAGNVIAGSNLDDENAPHRALSSKIAAKSAADAAAAPKHGNKNPAGDIVASKTGHRHSTHAVAATKAGQSSHAEDTGAMVEEDDAASDVDLPGTDPVDTETPQSAGRARISAGLQQLLKSETVNGVPDQIDDGNDEVKHGQVDNNQGQKTSKDVAPIGKEKTAASPSEELHALLGMVPANDDTDADAVKKPVEKPVKTAGHAVDDEAAADAKPVKAEHVDDPAAVTGMALPNAQAATVQHVGKHSDGAAARTKSGEEPPKASGIDKLRTVGTGGKGRPVDIELSKSTNHDHPEAAGGKPDLVTVLESRRYLGFTGDGGNASALTNAIKAEPSWAQVMQGANAGAQQTATEVNTLKLQMNPEHLGNMTASLRLKGDELSVEVRVETADAYHQLSQDQDSIVKALKDQGFSIDQVSIQLSPSARPDAGQGSANQNSGNQNNSNQYQSGSGGQNLQQGGQGGQARQHDEGARRNPNQNNWTSNDPTSTYSDSGIGRNRTDTGNLYL
jgi:chemotaxis protein MotD